LDFELEHDPAQIQLNETVELIVLVQQAKRLYVGCVPRKLVWRLPDSSWSLHWLLVDWHAVLQ